MKRFAFALFLAIAFCPVLASADENVSAVQTKLRQEGFYFGDVTGNYSDDTSAAITRYQIRRGLQITGELDEATAKALGVRPLPAAGPASTHSLSGTWRQLRSGEQQFVPAQPTPNAAPNASAIPSDKPTTTRQPKPATTRLPPVPPPVERRANEDPLGPDRLRDYVAAFILAGREPRVAAELEFFADRVDYFD
ncbi:MAG: peptidoglycan-binding domain-containing protein, partial [Chthoniobacterales bacterium]